MARRPHSHARRRALIMLSLLQEDDWPRDDLIDRVEEIDESAYGAAPEDAFLRDVD